MIFLYYEQKPVHIASHTSLLCIVGFLESLDDFYLMSNGLIMLQTTNNVFNMSLYDLVTPQSVPAWIRVRLANQKSEKSSDWGAWLNQSNSGMISTRKVLQ